MRVIQGRDGSRLIILGDARDDHPGICEVCHKPSAERRPYGPDHEWICPDCGERNPALTRKRIQQALLGESDN